MKRILPALTLIILVFGFAHYFVFLVTTNSVPGFSTRMLYAAIMAAGFVSMPLGFAASHAKNKNWKFLTWIGYIWMGFFSHLFFFSIIEFLIFVFYQHGHSEWVIYASTVIGIFSLYNGLWFPSVYEKTLPAPALRGFRLVQISDLHIGMLYLNEKWLARVADKILTLNPDALVITGDLVEGDFADISPQLQVLDRLAKIPHKYYITGNHEYIHATGAWEQRLTELGFTALHNENRIITHNGASLMIAGVPDRSVRNFVRNSESRPDIALQTDKKTDYKILLAHQPASVFDLRDATCDLILSGHTHGGQIFPFHLIVRMVQPVNAGFKKFKNTLVFAHRGTGFWGPPMRWFSRNEIVLFNWN